MKSAHSLTLSNDCRVRSTDCAYLLYFGSFNNATPPDQPSSITSRTYEPFSTAARAAYESLARVDARRYCGSSPTAAVVETAGRDCVDVEAVGGDARRAGFIVDDGTSTKRNPKLSDFPSRSSRIALERCRVAAGLQEIQRAALDTTLKNNEFSRRRFEDKDGLLQPTATRNAAERLFQIHAHPIRTLLSRHVPVRGNSVSFHSRIERMISTHRPRTFVFAQSVTTRTRFRSEKS